jgi:hypothetical protein
MNRRYKSIGLEGGRSTDAQAKPARPLNGTDKRRR